MSTELPVATRHRRDMTEKLLKATLNPNSHTHSQLNDHLFGKELFIRFSASAFRELPSIYVFSYFPFGFERRMWDLIVSVPGHCLSFYLDTIGLGLALSWRMDAVYP